MASHLSTRGRLLLLIDDMELISKELIENLIPRHQKNLTADVTALVDLLLSKDKELREVLRLAEEQAKIQEEMDKLMAKVEVHDQEIQKLQKVLKEAEHMLSTAIFQAQNKLDSIHRANERPVSADELIKYAHRISSAYAISAPLTWCAGDVRRPYPTDIEIRNGFLGKSDLNINGGGVAFQNNLSDTQRNVNEVPNSFQNQFNWNNLGELHMSMGAAGNSVALETRSHKETSQDDVEVMSTDTSSSSSSDSQ